MSLINITPQVDWSLDCGDNYCDGYCDTHAAYSSEGCDSDGCDSPISTHLVMLDGNKMSLCQWDFYLLRDGE